MSSNEVLIDLDAERREVQHPNGFLVRMRGEDFLFPAELPASALDAILSPELDLFGVMAAAVKEDKETSDVALILDIILDRPHLPGGIIAAIKAAYRETLGDQYERFEALRPSIGDYVRLTKRLMKVYGLGLGKLFAPTAPSKNSAPSSKPTSNASTNSTSEASGSGQGNQGSSGSDG